MYFLLHHATGVLMIQAGSREHAAAWSRRQLPDPNIWFSLIEWHELADQHEAVERSGTGIRETKYTNPETKVCVMSETAQELGGQDGFQTDRSDAFRKTNMGAAPAVIH